MLADLRTALAALREDDQVGVVARHLTDMEVVRTYEGTDSIQSLIVGRDITDIPAFG